MKLPRRCITFGGVVAMAMLCAGCPDGAGSTDGGDDAPLDLAPDSFDATVDGFDATVDDLHDAASERADALDAMDAPVDVRIDADASAPGCIPGMSVACACIDGRMGAQICLADGTFAACRCASADAAVPDVVLPPLGPRLITPQSVSRVTSRRPTMRWALPMGVTRARVELCGDRACTRMLQQQEVSGTSWRPTTMLAPGMVFWRVRGLGGDGSVVWTSPTWEYLVGRRDAPTDTSFGTLRDYNNDGYDDLAFTGTFGTFGEARACLVYGRATQGSQQCDRLLELPETVRNPLTGDFNGDGIADLVLPAGIVDSLPTGLPATLRVHYGRAAGISLAPDQQIQLRPPIVDGNGWTIKCTSGDFNGDGFSDIAVLDSLQYPYPEESSRGRPFTFRMYLGGAAGLEATPSRSMLVPEGTVIIGMLFRDFITAGDINADGYADMLATEFDLRFRDPMLAGLGRVWVAYGGPSLPRTLWHSVYSPTRAADFGATVAPIGDINGDRFADFAARSNHEVSIFLGATGLPTTPVRTLTGPDEPCFHNDASFGGVIGTAGDYNGDGRADLAVGAYCLPVGGGFFYGVGSVYLYRGTDAGVDATPGILRGMYPDSRFGAFLRGVGDFNGDGLEDLSVFESGRVQVSHKDRPPVLGIFLGSPVGITPMSTRYEFRAGGYGGIHSPVAEYMSFRRPHRGV